MTEQGATARAAVKKQGNLKTRVIAAMVLAPLVLALTWAGVVPFVLLVAGLAMLMAHEWAGIVHDGDARQFILLAVAGVAGAVAIAMPLPLAGLIVASVWVASILLTAWDMRGFTRWHVLGVPYLALPAFALVMLRAQPACGFAVIVFLFLAVWLADTLAYFAGKSIGGPKFAPRISPNKTWAGFGGAVAGGALAGVLAGLIFGYRVWPLIVLGALLGGWEQIGDLFESAAKRRFGVKDSGAIIPGHGGILDRVDGLVAAAVLALLWGTWVSGSLPDAACGVLLWGAK